MILASNPLEGLIAWAEIDLDALAFNVRAVKKHVGEGVEIIAVVKANAYGHGAVPVSAAALGAGVTRLGVHRAIEGVELRQAGIEAPILVMGYIPVSGAEMTARYRLTPTVMTLEFARALSSQAQALGYVAPVHIEVDTGLSRYGLMPDEVLEFMRALAELPAIRVEGMFTHFATADSADQSFMRQQVGVFNDVLAGVRAAGMDVQLIHVANSPAIMNLPEATFNAVRPGIMLYGLDPSCEWKPQFEIHPVLTLKSIVNRVHDIPAGQSVSYGRTFIAPQPMRVALVSVGYGDGYPRSLSNKGRVLIHGQSAPILGRVCMDQIIVDVSAIPNVLLDDEVVIIGRQGNDQIRAEEVAELAGTISYEITTSLLPRVTHIYKCDGQIVDMTSLHI